MSRRVTAMVFVVVGLGLPVVAIGAAGGTSAPVASDPLANPGALPTPAEMKAQLEKIEAERKKPEAVAARKESKAKFESLSDGQVAELVRDRKTPIKQLEAYRALNLREGETFDRFVSDHTAQVTRGDRRALVVSNVPLRAKDAEGKEGRVDLGLDAKADDYRLDNALVPLRLPRRLSDGVEFLDDGLTVDIAATRAGVSVERVGDTLVYPNSAGDVDAVLKPNPMGLNVSWLVRSAKAPEEFRLTVRATSADDKLELVETKGNQGVTVMRNGVATTHIAPPVAVDEDGYRIATEMRAVGNEVVVTAKHHDADLKYPLHVDPGFQDIRDWMGGDANTANWQYAAGGATAFSHFFADWNNPDWDPGLWLGAYQYAPYAAGSYAEWYFPAPRSAHVFRAKFYGFSHEPDATNVVAGIWGGPTQSPAGWETYSYYRVDNGTLENTGPLNTGQPFTAYHEVEVCSSWLCEFGYNDGSPGNLAVLALAVNTSQIMPQGALASIGAAEIWMYDNDFPTVQANSGQPPTSGWVDSQSFTLNATVTDAGLGPAKAEYAYPFANENDLLFGNDIVQYPDPEVDQVCYGGSCSNSITGSLGAVSTADMPTGIHDTTLRGFDLAGHGGIAQTFQVKVDHRNPELIIDGPLDAAPDTEFGPLDDPMPLTAATYNLNQIKALDNVGPENPIQSGPQKLKVTLGNADGTNPNVLYNDTSACPNNLGCEKQAAGTITPAQLPAGDRRLDIETIDGVSSHTELRQLKLLVSAGDLLTPTSGQKFASLIPLQAKTTRSGPTGVTFKYRLGADPWQTIPANKVKRPNGTSVSSWPVPLTSGETEALSWDARTTSGVVDGPIKIKATFSGSSNQGDSAVAEIQLNNAFVGSQYATADIGPGAVTLVNGNFALESDDVSIDALAGDLSVSRTYNSIKTLGAPTGLSGGPLGPGWTLATPMLSSGVSYTKLEALGNGVVIVYEQDGTEIAFQPASGSDYTSPNGFKGLVLKKVATSPDAYTLQDDDGNQVRFEPSGQLNGQPSKFLPASLTPGQGDGAKTTWVNDPVNGVKQPTRAVAPRPAGVSSTCTTDPVPAGCRVLKFGYATSTTATGTAENQWGDYETRLTTVTFVAAEPGGSVTSTPVARYSYDNQGRLRAQWDPRLSSPLVDRYDYNPNGILSEYTPPGDRPWHFTYAGAGIDNGQAKLINVSRDALPSGTATWSVAYDVPATGGGAPYDLSETQVAKWAQVDLPTKGVAVFPPTQVPTTSPPSSFTHATIHYLDANSLEVNVASPGGQIDTTEYDHHRNTTRELTAANRDRSLALGSGSASAAAFYDTRRTYNTDGTRLLHEYKPGHSMQVGANVQDGRTHTAYTYDVGAPGAGGPYNLVTSTTVSALVGSTDSDQRTTNYSYAGQSDLGWRLRKPTSVGVDPAGLNITTRTVYDEATGEIMQSRMPSDAAGTTAGTTNTVLYTSGGAASVSTCRNNPALAGLPCQDNVAAQPTSSLPAIPLSAYVYDRFFNETLAIDAAGSSQRYTGHNYDSADRLTSEGVTSTAGTSLPNVTHGYSGTTGRNTTTSTSGGTITRAHDSLGRLSTYTDATSKQTTYGYDAKDRLTSVADTKGTHGVNSYDLNDNATTTTDSDLSGEIAATYDADGDLLTQTLPNGIKATYVYDATGEATSLTYQKVTNCSSNCTWLTFTAVRNAHGQITRYTGTAPTGDQGYVYDNAGRLTVAVDIRAGQCAIRVYGYDADSNRTSERTIPPLGGGVCDFAGTGTTITRTYDEADRLVIGTTVTYDPFGNTIGLPSAAAGGSAITAGYFADNRIQSLGQAGTSYTYALDPSRRVLARSNTGSKTMHYGDDSDSPVWTGENVGESQYTRPIAGADGNLTAIYDSQAGGVIFYLADLHGDTVATAGASSTITGLATTYDADEFGVPRSASPRYGWLGAKERTSEFTTGTTMMGQRVYQPHIARFLQTDPISGGSANDYDYANQDSVNQTDLSGNWPGPLPQPAKPKAKPKAKPDINPECHPRRQVKSIEYIPGIGTCVVRKDKYTGKICSIVVIERAHAPRKRRAPKA
jgi:RHS repeat-associated protein